VPSLTVVAFVASYLRRRERNILLKVLLAFGALAALAMFFREVLSSLYDTRIPLARLFLWVQVIHAFDLPARKDLSYSLVSGLILIAVGAVLSTSLWYGLFVLAFLLCAMAAMSQINLSEARERAGVRETDSKGLVLGIVEERRTEVAALCEKYGVKRLDLFGSAAGERFDPEVSDLDFVVSFEVRDPRIFSTATSDSKKT